MHELAITEGVVAAVAERVPGSRVTSVRLEIGALSGVVADSVKFCFDLVTEGTNLDGALLEIVEPAASCQCRTCGAEFAPDWPILFCACGSADVAILSGQDLRILSVEVALDVRDVWLRGRRCRRAPGGGRPRSPARA